MSYTLKDFYSDILKMNELVGNDYTSQSEVLINKYIKLTKEESKESLESVLEKDHVLLLDGMVDTLVVGYFLLRVSGKELKSNYKITFKNKIDYFKKYIYFILKVHQEGSFLDNVSELIELTECGMNYLDFDFNSAFKEVMDSNLSKFPLIQDCKNPDQEIEYIKKKEGDRYKGIHYTEENGRYVFWDENKKFLKPSSFIEPNLKPFVNDESIIHDIEKDLDLQKIKDVVSAA